MYKNKLFRVRSRQEISSDIQWAKARYGKVQRIFLADGDALAMETAALLETLGEVMYSFPETERISIYAGPGNILAKTDRELADIRRAGVRLAYFGLESGDDAVLQEINKGVAAEEMITAATRLRAAGIELSMTVILGLGGAERSRVHVLHTAEVASRINPEYLAALTLMLDRDTPLARKVERNEFTLLSPREILLELRMLLAGLNLQHCLFRSNHASNYFAVGGLLPRDKKRMLEETDAAINNQSLLKAEYFRGL
jgi:radical SAM superfamily enzyme YgiQ (UPF0313 family)